MSRIFDALRRSEQELAGKTVPGTTDVPGLRDLITSLEEQSQDAPEGVRRGLGMPQVHPGNLNPSLHCEIDPEEPVVAHLQNHPGAEKFRVLSHRLRQLRQSRTIRHLLVTSAIPKEGKTVVALNLATTFASTSPKVLVVDADLRGPGLGRLLGLSSLPGMAEVLEGRCRLSDAVRKVTPFGFHCLPAGTASTNPVDLLQSPRMRELSAQLAGNFDFVFFDSPPLNLFADAHCIASLADAVLLVVRSGWTQREGVQQAVATLNGAYLAGVVLNGASESTDHRYYYHYYNTSAPSTNLGAQQSSTTENETPSPAPSPRESVRA